MKFIFKMLVLVGMIVVGKFMKEENTNELGGKGNNTTEDTYSMTIQEVNPYTQQTKNITTPTIKREITEETYTYSFN